jgi:hypothetical protein
VVILIAGVRAECKNACCPKPDPPDADMPLPTPSSARQALSRACRLPVLAGAALLLTACSSGDFLQQYQALDRTTKTAAAPTCQDVAKMTPRMLYGEWRLRLPQAGLSGRMRLSQHPEFSESLRGHIEYGAVKAIASGDLSAGNFDLDESSDGKRMTATWSGRLTPSGCGNEIRGTWTELDTSRRSDFVLTRLQPLSPSNAAPPPATRDELPEGVQVMPVPERSLN